MSASALAKATQRADPVEVFMAMCSANAHLCATDETALLDAVDHLQAAAIKLGLVDMDHVQAIMAEAFAPIREADERAEQAAAAIIPKREMERIHVPTSTLMAAEYLVREGDPERLRAWLMARPVSQRVAILDHIKRKARS